MTWADNALDKAGPDPSQFDKAGPDPSQFEFRIFHHGRRPAPPPCPAPLRQHCVCACACVCVCARARACVRACVCVWRGRQAMVDPRAEVLAGLKRVVGFGPGQTAVVHRPRPAKLCCYYF